MRVRGSGQPENRNGTKRGAQESTEEVMRLIRRNLQRKMLGHVMARIRKAQKLMGQEITEANEGEAQTLPAAQQRLVFRVNQMLWPWLRALCRISGRKELRRIHEWWERQGVPYMPRVLEGNVVYARFNVRTEHFSPPLPVLATPRVAGGRNCVPVT